MKKKKNPNLGEKKKGTTQKELQRINKEHFKSNPKAVKFCMDCDLVKKKYCEKCANNQINKLDNLKSSKK